MPVSAAPATSSFSTCHRASDVQWILEVRHLDITCEQPISCARYAWLYSSEWGGCSGWLDLNSVQIRHFSNHAVKKNGRN